MERTTKEEIVEKIEHINKTYGVTIGVRHQNGYLNLYDLKGGADIIEVAKTKTVFYQLLNTFERGLRIQRNKAL